ncbi:hypothetical protein COCC4DRAFT_66410 [Bipolaris maydis ATCC 48331]|uniref:Stress response RCI peptide n=2 Tax=Cochliobolus heterostrophus TaxID=5016 RepID=M2UBH5_COCH5|nr:uncharacterized protein COCC4DRAFT_66410 [Bipolaris maydis ATCC 48331]EMD85292.1 hypothetical protein COCHEDRAFT_1161573 [Bipolaris maydis C5]KAH7548640.1 hypothetical protein BM1_10938 [Bipolaris maydis]ENH99535.1 hypothetical protein COCC4DRAFT_66410 [Bipolaris maydis ATCC 48331]KAJ5023972.1 hypothetical protein J3E73DRAFT_373168 [Bipolaris maydis]KAJ5058077.1 hypothetical protein J3E74DRAFT_408332 [Bipolaris maydis]
MPSSTSTVLLYFLAIWLPFLPVLIVRGCSADLLINIALDILGWIPGVIHAWYIISQNEKQERVGVDPGLGSSYGNREKPVTY